MKTNGVILHEKSYVEGNPFELLAYIDVIFLRL